MIYLTGQMSIPKWRAVMAPYPELGMLLSPLGWRRPHSEHYALDNDAFAHSFLGSKPDPDFWKQRGERAWLRMLDRVPREHAPIWVALPDEVGNWSTTLERAWQYRSEVESRGFRTALVLQDGATDKDVFDFGPSAVFVGGTTRWKWENAPRVPMVYGKAGIWTHMGRCNGENRIRYCRKLGYDSADGTGLCKFSNAMLPGVLRGLRDESRQTSLWL